MTTLKLSVMIFSLFTFSRIIADDNTMYVNAKRGLIVRERPGIKYKKLSTLPFGSEVKILEYSEEQSAVDGKTGNWAKIKYNDSEGWVFNGYLSREFFQRVPDRKIALFLKNYKFGKLLKKKKLERDECNRIDIIKRTYEGGIDILSFGQREYDFTFRGAFRNVLGISAGFSREQVLKILGNPYSSEKNELEYISEKPEGYESEYFESRWIIKIFLNKNKVNQIRIMELFDDC